MRSVFPFELGAWSLGRGSLPRLKGTIGDHDGRLRAEPVGAIGPYLVAEAWLGFFETLDLGAGRRPAKLWQAPSCSRFRKAPPVGAEPRRSNFRYHEARAP